MNEDQLNKVINELKAAGVSDAVISKKVAEMQANPTAQPVSFSSYGAAQRALAPTIGGIAGGIIGSVAGPAGAVVGAGLGSSIGEAGRQAITPEDDTSIGDIVKQGLFGAGGELIGLGAGKLVGKVLGGTADDTAKVLRGRAINPLESAMKSTRNISSDDVLDIAQKQGFKGSARAQLGQSDEALNVLGKKMAKLVGEMNVNPAELSDDIAARVQASLQEAGINPGQLTKDEAVELERLITRVQNAVTSETSDKLIGSAPSAASKLDSLGNEISRELRTMWKRMSAGGTAGAEKEHLKKSFYDAIRGALGARSPEYTALNSEMSDILTAQPGMYKAAGETFRPFGLPVNIAQPAQAAGDFAGRTLGKINDIARNPLLRSAAESTLGGAGAFTGRVLTDTKDRQPVDLTSTYNEGDATNKILEPVETGTSQFGTAIPQVQRAMMAALSAGDVESFNSLASVMETLSNLDTSSSNEISSLPSASANSISLARSGLRGVDEVSKLLSEDPGIIVKRLAPGSLLTRQFDSALFRTVEALLRARSGAAVPESEVKRYMQNYAPRLGDSTEVARYKLDQLRRDLEDLVSLHSQGRGALSVDF